MREKIVSIIGIVLGGIDIFVNLGCVFSRIFAFAKASLVFLGC